jgi:hypothetical protein
MRAGYQAGVVRSCLMAHEASRRGSTPRGCSLVGLRSGQFFSRNT